MLAVVCVRRVSLSSLYDQLRVAVFEKEAAVRSRSRAASLSGAASRPESEMTIFMGGACNPTTWRFDVAIPAFQAEGIPTTAYYNPQVERWSPELVPIEVRSFVILKLLRTIFKNVVVLLVLSVLLKLLVLLVLLVLLMLLVKLLPLLLLLLLGWLGWLGCCGSRLLCCCFNGAHYSIASCIWQHVAGSLPVFTAGVHCRCSLLVFTLIVIAAIHR